VGWADSPELGCGVRRAVWGSVIYRGRAHDWSIEEEPTVARDPDTIQREIEQARDALAVTLDELGTKANPQRLVDTAKSNVRSTFDNPKVRYPVIGFGVLVVLLLIRKLFR
jgi:hypothetical protein